MYASLKQENHFALYVLTTWVSLAAKELADSDVKSAQSLVSL